MFFIDKYSSYCIKKEIFYKKEIETLKKISNDNSVPHMIFFGPPGSGVQILVKLFLEMLYDDQVHQLEDSVYSVNGSGNTTKEITIKQSNYHMEIWPNNNNFDRYLIQDIVKEFAKRTHLNVFSANKSFKTVFIDGVDNLSYYAQTSLRRTMEIYSNNCKFIMWCNSLSRVIDPLRSRCTCFRVELPKEREIHEMILNVCMLEKIKLTLKDFDKILRLSNRNIKTILWQLELLKYGISSENSYDETMKDIIENIFEKNIKNIPQIREQLYKMTITGITGTKIMEDILEILLKSDNINESQKMQITENAARYEYNLIRGRREIMHLDAFIISIINII
jgi:replication factor C subunit 3/5